MALLQAMWAVLLELAPWLLLGAAVAGALHVLLPPGFVRRHLGGRGGVVKAVALGVPLPLCSCGVIPAGLGLRRDGASPGASVGFLISTPQTGVDSVLVSASFLGWPFALLKVGAAAVTGVVGGWLTDAVGAGAGEVEGKGGGEQSVDRSLRGATAHAVDVLRTIWRWLVFGVVVSAIITVLVPPGVLTALTGSGEWLALVSVLLLSLPLYVCATASVPIAAALVAGGFPPGAALVFLMAGPATNVATLGAVYRGLGRRALVVYLSTIIVGSLGAALLFDFVLAGGGHGAHAHGDHGTPLAIAAALGLVVLLGWFALDDLRTWLRSRRPAPVVPEACTLDLEVEGMTCGGCANRLRRALLAEPGVVDTEVDHEAGHAVIRGTASAERLRDVVREAGFRPAS
ncbi:MAG: permease [Myxococcales bacterium]|nr:permease [Myxococcales bacterium]MCB9718336.1 permease [Myxococcales bacterium]